MGDGSDLVNRSGQTLSEIVDSVKRVTDIIAEISAASQEQASGIDQVNKAVMQMDQGTQQNAALVEQATSASQSMKQQAADLLEQVGFFKTTEESEDSGRKFARTTSSQQVRPKASGTGKKTVSTKSISSPAQGELVGVGQSNGHDARKTTDDFFEEF